MNLHWKRMGNHTWPIPQRALDDDAGFDLRWVPADDSQQVTLYPGFTKVLSVGFGVDNVPPGYAGFIADRSSIAADGINTGAGVIDRGYRGEIKMTLTNNSNEPYVLKAGTRVAQIVFSVFLPWGSIEVDELTESERGASGFGSTGHE